MQKHLIPSLSSISFLATPLNVSVINDLVKIVEGGGGGGGGGEVFIGWWWEGRGQKGKNKPITVFILTLCDWFSCSASATLSRKPPLSSGGRVRFCF